MSYEIVGIDHVQLAAPAGCEQTARQFYSGQLGLPEIPKPEALLVRGGVWFQCGRQQLHIGVESPFAPARKAHPAFEVSDLPAMREHLQRHSVAYKDDTARADMDRLYIDDPFGNRLEFLQWK